MSMNLAELGRVLCQEFDQRECELKTLQSEIRTRVKANRSELVQVRDADRAALQAAQKQSFEENGELLKKFSMERIDMVQGLNNDRKLQINEMTLWIRERGEELKGWHQAGIYMLSKRTGR